MTWMWVKNRFPFPELTYGSCSRFVYCCQPHPYQRSCDDPWYFHRLLCTSVVSLWSRESTQKKWVKFLIWPHFVQNFRYVLVVLSQQLSLSLTHTHTQIKVFNFRFLQYYWVLQVIYLGQGPLPLDALQTHCYTDSVGDVHDARDLFKCLVRCIVVRNRKSWAPERRGKNLDYQILWSKFSFLDYQVLW